VVFSLFHRVQNGSRSHPTFCLTGMTEVKRQQHEAVHSPPSSAEVMNAWSCTCHSHLITKAQGQFHVLSVPNLDACSFIALLRRREYHLIRGLVFWDVTPCSLVNIYRYIVGTVCLHLQGRTEWPGIAICWVRISARKSAVHTEFSCGFLQSLQANAGIVTWAGYDPSQIPYNSSFNHRNIRCYKYWQTCPCRSLFSLYPFHLFSASA
jgi:hypothetical protein